MNINCGVLIDGGKSLDEMGTIVFMKIQDKFVGNKTKSEYFGFLT